MVRVGSGAGFQQLKRLDNTISDNANRAADRSAANLRQLRQIGADGAKERRQRDREDLESLRLREDQYNQVITDNPDVDSKMALFTEAAVDRHLELAEEGARVQYTDPERFKEIKLEQDRLIRNYKILNQFMPSVQQRVAKFEAMMDAGEISPVDDDYLGQMLAIETGKWLVELDDKNNMVAVFQYEDEEGNLKTSKVNYASIMDNSWRPLRVFQLEDKDNKKGWISTISNNMGLTKKTTPEGFIWTTTDNTWGDKNEASLQAAIHGVLASDENMSSVLYQASGIKKRDWFSEGDYEVARNFLYTRVRGNIPEETSKKFDSGAGSYLTAQERLKLDKSKVDENPNLWTPTAVPVRQGSISSRDYGALPPGVKEYNLVNTASPGEYIKGIFSEEPSSELLSLMLSRDGQVFGKVRVTAKEVSKLEDLSSRTSTESTTTKGKTEVRLILLEEEELNRVAPYLGVRDSEQVVEYLGLVSPSGGGLNTSQQPR